MTLSSWTALCVALAILFFLSKSRWNYLSLPELPTTAPNQSGDVTVIIPARNEEANIQRVVRSLRGTPVIVVDDGSNDGTAALARQAGASVIPAAPLSKGHLGKPNACLTGARVSQSAWILFVDADTQYEPGFVSALVTYARRENLQAVSVFLRQQRVTFFERLLLPYAFALYFCGVSARRINNPKSKESLANGQCLLFERGAYDFIGGHGAVATSVIEDVALARIVKRHNMRSRVLRAERLGSVRMYNSFGAIWRGFQKNSFRFLLVNPVSALQVVTASILLTSYLPVLVWLLVERQWIAALVFAFVPALALFPWYGSVPTGLLAPLAIYVFQLIALNGMVTTLFGRKALWKGRRV